MPQRTSQGRWIPKGTFHKEGGSGQIVEKQHLSNTKVVAPQKQTSNVNQFAALDLLQEDLLQEDFEEGIVPLNSKKPKRAIPSDVAVQSATVPQPLASTPKYLTNEKLENTNTIQPKEIQTLTPTKHNGHQQGGVRSPITTTTITILMPCIHIPRIPSPRSSNKGGGSTDLCEASTDHRCSRTHPRYLWITLSRRGKRK